MYFEGSKETKSELKNNPEKSTLWENGSNYSALSITFSITIWSVALIRYVMTHKFGAFVRWKELNFEYSLIHIKVFEK